MKAKNLKVGLRVVHKVTYMRGYIKRVDLNDPFLNVLVQYDGSGYKWHGASEIMKAEKFDAAL